MECLTFCHSDVEISVSATPKTIFWKLHTYNPEQEPDSITVILEFNEDQLLFKP